ncbi:thioredoxin domain-containing protein [Sphingomonas tabacisoli]|uniref:Thioredoxin domain-containing protein n=1 Tax=Sphingomonas tabacisoli TaxID=2249466 RepID=A0ABW4I7Q9_9SPHN
MRLLGAIAAALALVAAAPATDWTHRVTQTPQGAFVLGNPAAKQRLVEYVSYTCPHCAHFTNEAAATLRQKYVANGSTAIEVRHAVRDPIDFAATLLARCTGPTRFFAVHEKLFATQESWFEAGAKYIDDNREALNKLPQGQQLQMLAKGAGLPAVVGLSEAQANACIANAAAQKPVLAMTTEAWEQRKIAGTPYFLVNGQGIDNTASWAALQPHLKN